MATPTQSPPPDPSLTTGSSPSPSSTTGNPLGGSLPSVSLVLYIFSVILALFVTIIGILVTRSVRRRRQRNGAFLAALASGTPSMRRSNHGVPEPKPVMWESLITSMDDEGKGWAGILPVAGVTSVPVHEAKSQQRPPAPRQPRLRFPRAGTRSPVAPNSPNSTAPPSESPVPSSNPVYLTVLVSMPTPRPHEDAKQVKGNGGPPIVELGVAEVTCTQNVTT